MQSHLVQNEFEFAGCCIQVEDAGGDFFGVRSAGNRIGFVVGDLMGNGNRAAAKVAPAQEAWKRSFDAGHFPSATLLQVNETLFETFREGPGFATVVSGQIDLETGTVLLASAGHPPPVLVRSSGCLESVHCRGVMAGILRNVCYTESVLHLDRGDLLCLYTDGVKDCMDPRGATQFEWVRRLLGGATGRGMNELLGTALDRLRKVDAATARHDDMAILLVRRGTCLPGGDGCS